jgi:hypothetical protein
MKLPIMKFLSHHLSSVQIFSSVPWIALSVQRLATGWTTEGSEFLSPSRVKNFLYSTSSRSVLGSTQPPTQLVPGALSLVVKRLGGEADHSRPTSAEVKKMWIYTSTPPYAFVA